MDLIALVIISRCFSKRDIVLANLAGMAKFKQQITRLTLQLGWPACHNCAFHYLPGTGSNSKNL